MILGTAIHHLSRSPCCRAAFFTVTKKTAYAPSLQRIAFSSLLSNEINVPSSEIVTSSSTTAVISPPFVQRRKSSRFYGSSNDDDVDEKTEETTFKPTWTYAPYKPPPTPRRKNNRNNGQQQRNFSSRRNNDNWVVPSKITIPEDKLEMSFERSSGAGGQNVNKVSTKVIIRMKVMESNWLPQEVRQRITQNESNKINKDGYLIINSQEYRTQVQNRKDVLDKLQELILKNYPRPKVRKIRKGISKKAKVINKEQKRWKSEVKKNRKQVDF